MATTPVKKSGEISVPLQKNYEHTSSFVVKGRGKRLLGVGKPHIVSGHAPKKAAQRVSQAVTGSPLLPNKKLKT
jgi:hypothetical protein